MTTTPAAATFANDHPGHRRPPAQHRGGRARAGQPQRPDAVGGPCRARTAVAPLGRDPSGRPHRQGAAGVLPVDGVPDRPHAGQRHRRAGPARWRRCRPGAACPASWRTWPTRSPMPASATAAWAGSRRASSTRWPRSGCRRSATASATNTACSRRRSTTAARWNTPTRGSPTARRGSFRAPASATRCALAAGSNTRAAPPPGAMRPRWPPRPTTW